MSEPMTSQDLNWSDTPAPCRCCGTATQGRDAQGPVHQSCAQREFADELAARQINDLVDERWPGRSQVTDERWPGLNRQHTGGDPQ